MGKLHQGANRVEDFDYQAVGSVRAMLCYVFANVVEVNELFWMERIPIHAGR